MVLGLWGSSPVLKRGGQKIEVVAFPKTKIYTPEVKQQKPLKSYRNPKGKDRLLSIIFQGLC